MPATSRGAAEKLDVYVANKAEYAASRTPKLVRVRRARYIAISGEGKPGETAFQDSIGALYMVAYTVKMARKFAGRDFAVSKLEGQYWWSDSSGTMRPEDCQWQLLIRVPSFITEREARSAVAKLIGQGKPTRVSDVSLVNLEEGRCVQALHVGPYDTERSTLDEMTRFAKEAGLRLTGRHHEIYLSDPRRIAPERLKTILRQPVV